MADPTSGSVTETYATTTETTEVTVVPRIITQSQQIARYFAEDLLQFLKDTKINLAEELQIPPEYTQDPLELVEMLYDDLAHLLRDGLITGVHLLLSEQVVDKTTHAYPLRYHAWYLIQMPERTLKISEAKRFGGKLAPPRKIADGARFVLLIDWNMTANERRRQARRPEYCFDWVPESSRFDATTLIRYREGGMTVDSATVSRWERVAPGF